MEDPTKDWPEHDWSGRFDEKEDEFRKDDKRKRRYSLLPPHPLGEVVDVFEHGAQKYGDYNWMRCTDPQRYWDAAMRHMMAMHAGERFDESGYSHAAHAVASLLILMDLEVQPRRPNE